jgi:hypothetical protein
VEYRCLAYTQGDKQDIDLVNNNKNNNNSGASGWDNDDGAR